MTSRQTKPRPALRFGYHDQSSHNPIDDRKSRPLVEKNSSCSRTQGHRATNPRAPWRHRAQRGTLRHGCAEARVPDRPGGMTAVHRLAVDDTGRVTAFVVVIVTAVLAFSGLVLDGGLALAAKVRAIGEAQEAARAGVQAIDLAAYRADGTLRLVPDQASTLARTYLTSTGDSGTVTVAGNSVTVTVTTTQKTQLLGLLGIGSMTMTGSGSAHPERGVTAPQP